MADLAVVALGLDATGMTAGAAQANRALTSVEAEMAKAEKQSEHLGGVLTKAGSSAQGFGAAVSKSSQALTGLGGPIGQVSGQLGGMSSQLEGLVSSFGLLGGAAVGALAGVTALGSALVKLTLDGVKLSDEMGDIAEGTGLTVDQVQRLSAAFKLAGEDASGVERSFRTFQSTVQEAIDDPTGKAAITLARLGVDAKAAGKDTGDAFINAIARLKELRQTTEGAVATNEAFGRGIGALVRSSESLQKTMGGTREALESDFVVASEKAIQSGQALDTQINKISNSWDVFKQNLAGTKVGDIVADSFDSITGAIKTLSAAMSFIDNQIAGSTYLQVLFGFAKAAISPFSLVGKSAAEGLTPQFKGLFDIGQSQPGSVDSRLLPGPSPKSRSLGGGGRSTAIDQEAKALANAIREAERENAAIRKAGSDALIKDMEAESKALNALVIATAKTANELPVLKDTIVDIFNRLGIPTLAGTAAPPISGGGIPGAPGAANLPPSQIISAREARIEDALGGIFEDFVFQITTARSTVGDAFKGLLLGITDTFAVEFAKAFQQSIQQAFINPLAGWLEDALSSIFSSFKGKGLLSFFKAIGGGFAGLFAEGGTIPAAHWGIVGERGPEIAFAGSSPMQISPMGGGGGMSISMHFAISTPTGDVSQRTQDQVADAAARGIERAQRLRGAR